MPEWKERGAEDSRLTRHPSPSRPAFAEILEDEGWSVESLADGNAAMNRIAGGVRYDLLLLDNDLPGVSGIELTRYARHLNPYRTTPIILLSAGDHGEEARRAGADVFLRKPEDVARLVAVVGHLLNARRAK